MTPAVAATQAVYAFLETFNAQDHEAHAQTLNYPHVRLAGGRFARLESSEEFTAISAQGETRLKEEGWHHSTIGDLTVIHEGEDKVHIALDMHRCHEDGTVYKRFDTLWIATRRDGKWGIQFRSSYLR